MLIKEAAIYKDLRFKKISIPPVYGIILSPCEYCKKEYFVPSEYRQNKIYTHVCAVNDICMRINTIRGRIKTNYRYCDPEKKGDR